ncbi:MAG TPA: hypothetical protein VNX68_13185 [Nitrosopumilaceae archaeon]|nr:hypothetical protein [Nitrosopumilaceae archaeon]
MIPGIFGYGISVADDSEEKCMTALKKSYKAWKKQMPDKKTNFETSYEYWGGYVKEVELGKIFFDNFSE